MLEPGAVAAIEAAAQGVHTAARAHHKAADFHKRQARELMAQHAALEERLAALGITLRTVQAEGKGATGTHDRST